MDKQYESVKKLLVDSGINVTIQRLQMAALLLSKPQHLTAEQVFQLINENLPNASRATIFNNLKLFVEKGIISVLELNSGYTLYDSRASSHEHAVIEETGEIIDLDIDDSLYEKVLSELKIEFKRKTGKEMKDPKLFITMKGAKT
ncbi:MAG: Fur family transcriptional regulator [Leptospiraceae bacterium]|nr:Fur family transcriptional regulator [Leptospiraceae bacterium]